MHRVANRPKKGNTIHALCCFIINGIVLLFFFSFFCFSVPLLSPSLTLSHTHTLCLLLIYFVVIFLKWAIKCKNNDLNNSSTEKRLKDAGPKMNEIKKKSYTFPRSYLTLARKRLYKVKIKRFFFVSSFFLLLLLLLL